MAFQKLPADVVRNHKGISFPGIATVFMCHDGQGNMFLTKRSQKARDERGRWESGGGGLKHGQSVEANLKRELKEEYDVEPLRIDFIGYSEVFRKSPEGLDTHWIVMYYAVLIDPGRVKINEPDMIDDYGWFPPDSLPSPLLSEFPAFFKRHGQKYRQILRTAKR
jgi:ADP-ribose pyrophosphatase YjhB (NUDIX family)